MIRNIILLACAALLCGTSHAFGQSGQTQKQAREAKREAWREARAKERAQRAAEAAVQDSISYEQALQALQSGAWVLQANQVTFRNGMVRFVSSGTNFIAMNNQMCTIQTAFDNFSPVPSPNGLGGVTVEGAISPITTAKDENGSIFTSFSVMGAGISAIVHLWLTVGTNQANANIYPNFTPNIMSMSGTLVPYSQAAIFEGNAW